MLLISEHGIFPESRRSAFSFSEAESPRDIARSAYMRAFWGSLSAMSRARILKVSGHWKVLQLSRASIAPAVSFTASLCWA